MSEILKCIVLGVEKTSLVTGGCARSAVASSVSAVVVRVTIPIRVVKRSCWWDHSDCLFGLLCYQPCWAWLCTLVGFVWTTQSLSHTSFFHRIMLSREVRYGFHSHSQRYYVTEEMLASLVHDGVLSQKQMAKVWTFVKANQKPEIEKTSMKRA